MMENSCEEPHVVVEKILEAIDALEFCDILELGPTFEYVGPAITQTLETIYARNDNIVRANEGDVLQLIQSNFQVALRLMDISNKVLQFLINSGGVSLHDIQSFPISIARVLLSTFNHCKNSQNTYSHHHKSASRILELFKASQQMHTQYLTFLDSQLTVDFTNTNESQEYEQILDILVKISISLAGVNMKSMVDNWKAFITLVQKPSSQGVPFSISTAIQYLTKEINDNLLIVCDLDPNKPCQDLKVTGFLVKVALKLMECGGIPLEDYENVFNFWIMIYSWDNGYFQTNKSIEVITHLCAESKPSLLCQSGKFLKALSIESVSPQKSIGLLKFILAVIEELPQQDVDLISLLQLIFSLSKSCFVNFFYDYNSKFYEDLVTNLAVMILLSPSQFSEVEKLFLECVIDGDIWLALIAIDVWCLVLKYSPDHTCGSTVRSLIKHLRSLNIALFHQTPAILRLKILTQRLLKVLPSNALSEEISQYNPSSDLFAWKILNIRNCPLSHRYYVEFLMCDIAEKMELLKTDCSMSDFLNLMEVLDIISYTNFSKLEVATTRLTQFAVQLWSFGVSDSRSSNFTQHFLTKLLKITATLTLEFGNEDLLVVLSQLASLQHHMLHKLLVCTILGEIPRRNFNTFVQKHALFTAVANLLKVLLADTNSIVVQLALESFLRFHNSSNHDSVVKQVMNTTPEVKTNIVNFLEKRASESNYDRKYLERICSFESKHSCYDWGSGYQSVCKKIKLGSDTDGAINVLKLDVEKLCGAARGGLTVNQKTDIRSVISKLEQLL